MTKKIALISIGVLLLFLGFGIGRLTKNSPEPAFQNELSNVQLAVSSSNPSAVSLPVLLARRSPPEADEGGSLSKGSNPLAVSSSNPPADGDLATINRVIDGDTIELSSGEKVRYIGMDTPETVDPRKPIQCFGVEASERNKALVFGKEVRLEKDVSERDKYGRLLRYIWLGNILVNLELVKEGFASASTYPPDVKYQSEFAKAEAEARTAKRGLWQACQNAEPSASSAIMNSAGPNGCVIKGNIGASGDKIYHLPGCPYYDKTKIDEARGEKWFCTEAEAIAAGWRKALNCP